MTKRDSGPAKKPKRRSAETRADLALVERTVELIVEHERGSARSLRDVGESILAEYFGGDLALVKSRSPAKPKSYQLLAERAADAAGWDERDFRRAVTVAATARSLPAALASKLSMSHLLALAAIDDPTVRVDAATKIARRDITGDDAKAMLAKLAATERHGGRPRMLGPIRATGQIERALAHADDAGDFEAAEIRAVPAPQRPALADRLDQLAEKLQQLAQRLRR
jgi:hypothetical protein